MYSIFVVEDDAKIRNELMVLLQRYGYRCLTSDRFERILEEIEAQNPSLVLLDINLPYYDGYHVCQQLRQHSNVPIIIVTSRDSEMDELMSINLGADDFITKPYNTQILLARISSVLKRAYQSDLSDHTLSHKGVVLHFDKSTVEHGGNTAELTKNELGILRLLMQNKETILSREQIMNELWQSDEFIDDNTLTVNINRLRKKLESIGVSDFLITKRGQGYLV